MTATAYRSIQINLPPLHKGRDGSGGQLELDQDNARFQVVFCGRRWGKTTYGVRKCVKGAIEGGTYWWVGPTFPIASIGWRMLKKLVVQIPDIEIREADRCVILPNAGEIWIKSADNPDSLRGEKLSGVVLDEFAQIKEAAWEEALRPALSDTRGWALFIGTPMGNNWAYRLWQAAAVRSGWKQYKKSTLDNPYISEAEIAQAKTEMSEERFKQEFEADIGASQLLVFPEFSRTAHVWKGEIPVFDRYYGGLDFGGTTISAHKSSGVVIGRTKTDDLVIIAEFEQSGPHVGERQLEWMAQQIDNVAMLRRKSKLGGSTIMWRADKTQMWGIQLVRQMGFAISMSKGGKDSITEGLELVHRRLKIRSEAGNKPKLYYLPHLHFVPEAIERYRYPDQSDNEDKLRARNPLAVDDDTIDAIRYCIEGVDFGVIGDPNQIYRNVLPNVR